MKIIYLAAARIPTERAHGIQIMQMCAAFKRTGAEVELWIPARKNSIPDDSFAYYGVKTDFPIRRFPVLEVFGWPLGFFLFQFSFMISAGRGFRKINGSYAVYTRDFLPALAPIWRGMPVFWEAHDLARSFPLFKFLWKRLRGVVAISEGLKRALIARGVAAEKICVSPDGFDEALFSSVSPVIPVLTEGLPAVVYAGSAKRWKGVFTLLDAARELSREAEFLFLLSGPDAEIEAFEKQATGCGNVRIMRHIPPADVPGWLAAASVIAIPNSAKTEISRLYTSPLKVFEAMAACRPIVASRIPSIQEILNETNSLLVEPDNPAALAGGIRALIREKDRAAELARQARSDSCRYGWDKRAVDICRWLESLKV